MAIMYLSKENFTCPKGRIMHKELGPYCADINFFCENGMKPDIKLIENSVDPYHLASEGPTDQDPQFSKQHASLK